MIFNQIKYKWHNNNIKITKNILSFMAGYSSVRPWDVDFFGIIFWWPSMASFFVFYQLYSKFQLWCHSILIVSFIYLIRSELSHSMKLWYRRTSLIICAYFEKFNIAHFKKSISCFKLTNSWLENIWLILQQGQIYLNLINSYLA